MFDLELTVGRLIEHVAAARPDGTALLAPGRPPLTYAQLRDQAQVVCRDLARLQVGPQDRVALLAPNGPEAASAFLAIAAGAACAPLNPDYRESELEFLLSDLRARAVIVGRELDSPVRVVAQRLGIPAVDLVPLTDGPAGRFQLVIEGGREAPTGPAPGPDDVALLLHTSGTTAQPKLVPLRQRNICLSARNIARTLELSETDRCLNVMPLFHVHGLVGALLSSIWAGAEVVCTPGFRATSFFDWLEELSPTWYTAVPTMHQAVLARATDRGDAIRRSRIRFVRSSSAPLAPAVLTQLESTFLAPAIEAYGMTEGSHQVASNPLPPGERRPGSVGLTSGLELAVLDERGNALPPGQIGEVALRGETVFAGYERNPDANRDSFSNGWFRTGDEGYLDEDGYLFLRGRLKEIINRGGEKISPREVDEVLLQHPAVAQAVTFAVPDPDLGEEIGVAVVPGDGASLTAQALQEFAAARLAGFKIPRVVEVVDEIPRGPTGKLQRIGLAETLGVTGRSAMGAPGTYVAPRSSIERELAELFGDVLRLERVGIRDDFFDLGGDSLLATELVARLRERYGRPDLMPTELLWAPTVEKLAARVPNPPTEDEWSPLVELQAGSGMNPLFCVHGLDGGAFAFAALARCLGPDRPFYALRARGADGRQRPHARLESMAAEYLQALKPVRPHGPYYLGGVCAGGPIALEMADRLTAEGERVGIVVLFDPRGPRQLSMLARQRRIARAASRVVRWKIARAKRIVAQRTGRVDVDPAEAARIANEIAYERFRRALARARERYRPRPYSGSVIAFKSLQAPTAPEYWDSLLLDGVEWHELPVGHLDLLRRPQVEKVAELLAPVLDRRDRS